MVVVMQVVLSTEGLKLLLKHPLSFMNMRNFRAGLVCCTKRVQCPARVVVVGFDRLR